MLTQWISDTWRCKSEAEIISPNETGPPEKLKDQTAKDSQPTAARAVAAFLDNLEDEEASHTEEAAKIGINMVSISMNDAMNPTELMDLPHPSPSSSLLDSLYEFKELQENMDILPTSIITVKRARYTAKTIPDTNKTHDGSDSVCDICGED